MQERDEALDFIYKGFRDGRQNRRNVMNQRGADRIAARRERMAQYGSPSMQMQTPKMRGPPSQSNVASSPPSTIGNFTDDISTLDDESTWVFLNTVQLAVQMLVAMIMLMRDSLIEHPT